MNWKTKFTLIIWWIITFIWWWVIFVISLLGNTPSAQNDILWEKQIKQQTTTWNTQNIKKEIETQTLTNHQITWNTQKVEKTKISISKDKKYSLNILYPNNLLNYKSKKIFNLRLKKISNWNIIYKWYENLNEYYKDLVVKLTTKDNNFDLAIIPSEWYKNISNISDVSFQVPNLTFQLDNLFDINFSKYLKNNNIKAIPFGIDPIIWYWYNENKNIEKIQNFNSWKNIIINNPNRLQANWKIKNMPVFLWYDKFYLKLLKRTHKSLFPIFNNIVKYYVFKKWKIWLKTIKSFWEWPIYKSFDSILYKKLSIKYRNIKFCKNNINFCLLIDKKSNLVYDFLDKNTFFKKNWLDIYKKFRIRYTNIIKTTLPLAHITDEYPAKWRIIIINPNSKNIKYVWKFLQSFIKLWQKHKLPFYKTILSPFVWFKIENKQLSFLNQYIWRFIFLENFWIKYKDNLTPNMINYLNWDISIDTLLK